jgi:succinate dehydrogenase/fumarate reductase cytochrome b subunit
MDIGYNGIFGILILAGDVWAILNIAQSSASNEKKALWIVLVVVLPLLGLILWYFLGPRDGKKA